MFKHKLLTALMSAAMLLGAGAALPSAEDGGAVISASADAQTTRVKLDAAPFEDYSAYNNHFYQTASDKDGGIYTFNNGTLWFTNAATGATAKVKDLTTEGIPAYADYSSIFEVGGKLYILENDYAGNTSNVLILDLSARTLTKKLSFTTMYSAIGADSSGRIFLAGDTDKKVTVFSSSGTKLTTGTAPTTVYRFTGFDSTNGNFYYEGYYNYVYWGYDHETTSLFAGNFKSSKLTFGANFIDVLYQNYWYDHNGSAMMVNNKYMIWTANMLHWFTGVFNSNSFSDITSESAEVPVVMSANLTENSAGSDSYGVRTVYNSAKDSFIVYTGEKKLTEYDQKGEQTTTFGTQGNVFALYKVGDNVCAVEKDDSGNYYLETIPWTDPTYIRLDKSSASLKTNGSAALKASTDSLLEQNITWTSSNSKIATVDSNGRVYGVKAGTATISAKLQSGLTATCRVTVTDRTVSAADFKTSLKGVKNDNAGSQNYYVWASAADSYLFQNTDGTLWRVENTSSGVVAEKYSKDGKTLQSTVKITQELPLFGGAFSGKDYNYIVFGQTNPKYSDSVEVLRVVRYTKDWKKSKSVSIKGANTYVPFEAGALRMAELDGKLYIHTCHKMYQSGDGYNHQANMTFIVKESDMTVLGSHYGVSNLGTGYVSHSFNQFIQASGDNIYRADHGEGYPDGLTLTILNKNSEITDVTGGVVFEYDCSGNYSGATLGGLAVSEKAAVLAYTYDVDPDNGAYLARNVYVSVVDLASGSTKQTKLTSFTKNSSVFASTPQIVKLNDYLFAVMWEESENGSYNVKYVIVDGAGRLCSAVTSIPARLSECQPILCSDGSIRWTASSVLYCIDPFDLTSAHIHDFSSSKITTQPTYTSTGVRTYTCSVCGATKTETVAKLKYPISSGTVSIKYASYTYTGKAITPDSRNGADEITVTCNGKKLVKGTDYTVSYSNNVNVGYQTAAAVITGKGDYTGTLTKKFTIKPKKQAAPTVTTKNGGFTVKWTADSSAVGYQVLYCQQADFDPSCSTYHSTTIVGKTSVNLTNVPKAGETWYIKVRAFTSSDGTVNGVRYGNYSTAVTKKALGNVTGVTIPNSSYTYTGKAISPQVTVTDSKGSKLRVGIDYTVSYSGNISVGQAVITVTGKGNYQGTVTKTFMIKPAVNAIKTLTSTAKNSFTVTYTKATAGASGYQILYCKNSSFSSSDPTYHSTSVTDLSTLSKTVTANVKSGETWYVKVRSYVIQPGTATRYGRYSAVKTVKIK